MSLKTAASRVVLPVDVRAGRVLLSTNCTMRIYRSSFRTMVVPFLVFLAG